MPFLLVRQQFMIWEPNSSNQTVNNIVVVFLLTYASVWIDIMFVNDDVYFVCHFYFHCNSSYTIVTVMFLYTSTLTHVCFWLLGLTLSYCPIIHFLVQRSCHCPSICFQFAYIYCVFSSSPFISQWFHPVYAHHSYLLVFAPSSNIIIACDWLLWRQLSCCWQPR